ncbi:MAG: extracellular solute-binding protein [Alphaproteobacteria bacterium]|nr:extracellular solute-binding protein [Alphaproteobacteria bacterium]
MIKKGFLIAAVLFACFPAHAARYGGPQTSLAMTGEALRSPGFSHFLYADPAAPKGGLLKLGVTGTFDSLNPFIVRGQAPLGVGVDTFSLVYERLMVRASDEPFTLYGLIAESVELADDRSGIVFNLSKSARFSDGTPVTADDVLFSYETLRDKGRPNHRTYYKKVEKAEVLSPLRIRFTFKTGADGRIDREMPLIMGYMPVLPRHDWAGRAFNETTLRVPVGSGPYRVEAVDAGRSISFARNDAYWAKDLPCARGLYNFEKIRVDYYRDDSVSLQAFKAGQYDIRREADPNRWMQAYDVPASRDGRVQLEKIAHRRVEPAYGFMLNTRRPLLADPALRAALQFTFDFDWVNRNLFRGQYRRVNSFFPNSELAASGVPRGRELEILRGYADRLPSDIFTKPVEPPQSAGRSQFRAGLLKAEALLRTAGYRLEGGRLQTPGGIPVSFEVMLSDPAEEKVALNWAASLRRLGIEARVHTVDSAQYQSRFAAFDFDVTANKWMNSLSPGNEQSYFWGSVAAGQKGSRNYAGVRDAVVDDLAARLPNASTREELVALTRALDRVLMRGHYFVPLYYLGTDNVASWSSRVLHPARFSPYGNVMESWWARQAP